jgi:fatty-acyl-CoA synthase
MSEHHPRSPHRPAAWIGAWSQRRASLSPDRVGLVDVTTGQEFTYADLDQRANRVARLLSEHNVTADDDGDVGGRVAVVSRNRPELVDLFFATGKTGGVLAPLSHRLATPELRALLDKVDPELLVVEEPFDDQVRAVLDHDDRTFDCPILSLPTDGDHAWDAFADALPAEDGAVETATLSMDDAHLFLHTGGSTGTPKETVITHGGVVWNSVNTITAWGLRDDDVTPMVFPMFHTGGWNVITVPIWHMGGTVLIARELDPGEILRLVEDRESTVLIAVPAVLRAMSSQDRWAETDLSTLRFVKSGGGPCRESVMDAWWDRGVDLSQGYGLTECGPNNFAMPDDWPREKSDSVGVPDLHVETRIVEDGERVEPGEIGELEIASPHGAGRYWRNETETAEAFGGGVTDGSPGPDADRGWISTGDLARVDKEGYHYIEGRKKHMFVSGGENVYPAAVEDAIADHPAVAEVVVVPIPDEQWGQVGRAIVELADDAEETDLDLATLREFLDDRLARFKHPRDLAFVASMPTSGPSKIDREAVAERFGESIE